MSLHSFFLPEIRRHHFFSGLSENCFRFVLEHSGLATYKKNELVFEQGHEAKHFFLVRTGQVTFYQVSSDGNEKIVDIYDSGQVCAESIMFVDDQRYSINARATCDTELFYFNVQDFKKRLKESNELCFSMMSEMGKRIKVQTQEIVELSLYDAQYRLVKYLLKRSCNENQQQCEPVVILSATKSIIASRLSITPETFSRILSRLRNQGLISIKDDVITLIKVDKLRELIGYFEDELIVQPKSKKLI